MAKNNSKQANADNSVENNAETTIEGNATVEGEIEKTPDTVAGSKEKKGLTYKFTFAIRDGRNHTKEYKEVEVEAESESIGLKKAIIELKKEKASNYEYTGKFSINN